MLFTTRNSPGSYVDFVQITQDVIEELTDFKIKDTDMLNIPYIKYFEKLSSVLAEIPEDDLEHYLTFRQLIQLAESTTSKMRDYFHIWSQMRGGSEIPKPRQVIKTRILIDNDFRVLNLKKYSITCAMFKIYDLTFAFAGGLPAPKLPSPSFPPRSLSYMQTPTKERKPGNKLQK